MSSIKNMVYSNRFQKIINSNYFLIFSFFILSIISGALMWKANFVGGAADLHFHWQRIYELRKSISNGNWFPRFALNQFNQNGEAVMTMYPYINLFPITLLSFVIKSFVPLIYITFMLRNFFSLIISYYSSYHFYKNKSTSLLFATSYSLSTVVLSYWFQSMDFGVTSSILFLPMVIFGFYNLLKNNQWLELSIGTSLVIFSHVLSAAIIVMTVLIMALMNFKKLKQTKFIYFFKAVGMTLLTTSIFWIPFIILTINNHISMPPMYFDLGGTDFNTLMNGIFSNQITTYVNVSAFVGLILGIINYKKLDPYVKQLFWLSVGFMIACSNFFPWVILNDTFLRTTFQFSWRLYIIPQSLLCYIFAYCLVQMLNTNLKKSYFVFFGVIFIIGIQVVGQKEVINQTAKYPIITTPYNGGYGTNYRINSADSFKNIISNDKVTDSDYYPSPSLVQLDAIINHQGIYDINKRVQMNLLGNGKYSFNTTSDINELNLPFLYYNGAEYHVILDGKQVSSHSNVTSLLTINGVPKGEHHIQVIVKGPRGVLLSLVMLIISMLIYIRILYLYISKKLSSKHSKPSYG